MPKLFDEVNLERELRSDLEWLQLKADRLVKDLARTRDKITRIEQRLESYPLPDGRTK